ncbi:MAG: hypothetical protein KDD60_08480, partial [Bdellovibrionales bacterium]|nr:hypothetical protein [Bdellovibrionales bacterium]
MKNSIQLEFGDVRVKSIETPNHFVSHMLEHIAWRLGVTIALKWQDCNWRELGVRLGTSIGEFPAQCEDSAAIGMIDDGSASVTVQLQKDPASKPIVESVTWSARGEVDLEWFFSLRCEQIENGQPLIALFEGIISGLGGKCSVVIWNLEDPHHTWEGIFRGLGIALSRIFTPLPANSIAVTGDSAKPHARSGDLAVLCASVHEASVQRKTAETAITGTV